MPELPPGRPGLPPNWSSASKQAVGTACNDASKVWFTVSGGVVTEVFYPTVVVANIKDLQFLVTDGKRFFDEERRDTVSRIEYIDPRSLAFRITNTALSGNYRIVKEVFTDPQHQSLIIRASFEALGKGDYRLYALLAPHLRNRGYGNSGRAVKSGGRDFLVAWNQASACVLASDKAFLETSCGYSGISDAWQDLNDNFTLDWRFREAIDGNIALAAGIEPGAFTLVLSFGSDFVEAAREAEATLGRDPGEILSEYVNGWHGYLDKLEDLGSEACDGGRLYWISAMVLKSHEDKAHRGGVIASLSVPWGEARTDTEAGGYHVVWPRDLVKAAFGFLAAMDRDTPVSVLRYLEMTQREDGSWPQNMWLDGRANWSGVQLDEVSFPIILAWRLKKMGLLKEDFYPMVKRAASYILKWGPITEQERWEENSGFSPSTLAAEISALVCAAHWAQEKGESTESRYLFEIADYWQTRLEDWTFTDCGCVFPDYSEHYQRIASVAPEALDTAGAACEIFVPIKNIPAQVMTGRSQCAIVDGGFLELVRYGIRHPKDPHVVKTLPVVDNLLKVETPGGPAWHRYNYDGYGEKEDGSPFDGSGVGRAWPLLSGERGMYELLAGGSAEPHIRAMEAFANEGGMLPEQVWDTHDIPEKGLRLGRGTGSATPLLWAHAEYIKLLRTKRDRRGCDIIPEVRERYVEKKSSLGLSAWKKQKPIRRMRSTDTLRLVAFEETVLHWSKDGWGTATDSPFLSTGLGLFYLDIPSGAFKPGDTLVFTLYYPGKGAWEGTDYSIAMV